MPESPTPPRSTSSDGAGHRGAAAKLGLRSWSAGLDWPFVRGVLFERVVNTVLMVVAHVITHEPE